MPQNDTVTTPDLDWLTGRIVAMVDDEGPIDPAENLLLYGLDSIQVMTLAGDLEAMGIRISFQELAQNPSIEAWWALIRQRQN